jgi:G2/mitotic-specific cyclin-B, other
VSSDDPDLQKCKPVNVDGDADGGIPKGPRKPAQKKATVKPKPEAVIEISSDSEQVKNEKPRKKKSGEESSRKNAPTLTSTLTARSKVNFFMYNDAKSSPGYKD